MTSESKVFSYNRSRSYQSSWKKTEVFGCRFLCSSTGRLPFIILDNALMDSSFWFSAIYLKLSLVYGPRREKTRLSGFQQSETQTNLLSFSD